MFKGLYYAAHLNTLSVDITPSTSISSVSRLLKVHANTVHTLSISAIDFHSGSLNQLLQEALVPLPYLISLTINFDLSEGPILGGFIWWVLKRLMERERELRFGKLAASRSSTSIPGVSLYVEILER